MKWLNWSIGLTLVGMLLLILRRWQRQFQLNHYKNKQQPAFQKKFLAVQRRETVKHVRVLLISSLVILLTLGILVGQIIQLEAYWYQLKVEQRRIKEEMIKMKTQQAYFFEEQSVKAYPQEGLGLKGDAWQRVVSSNESRKVQGQLEQQISQKLSPYFGGLLAVIRVDVKEKGAILSLQIETNSEEEVEKNITSLLRELWEIPTIAEVEIQLSFPEGTKKEMSVRRLIREEGASNWTAFTETKKS
ncbi:hypothetical protein IGI37_003331 [Enterococcus sp. AZ194]|uniref:hypothetical protein n=1 Tax=Enterococcus sp. AZ194 TaxID=2774629 RepID=UPI003F25E7F4